MENQNMEIELAIQNFTKDTLFEEYKGIIKVKIKSQKE
jgi:hypothetical protein